MEDFKNFIKEQGVIGVAVGLTIGLAAVEMINRVLAAIVTPIITWISGGSSISEALAVTINEENNVTLKFGEVIDAVIQFLILAFVVYMMIKVIGADKWDKK